MHYQFGDLVKQAREQHHLNQDELGEILGMDDATVSKIETNSRPLYADELLALALVFEDWFEFQTENFTDDITADLATRVRIVLEETKFPVDELGKREWIRELLFRLDHCIEPTISI